MRSTAYVSDVVSNCIPGLDSKNDNTFLGFNAWLMHLKQASAAGG